MARKHVDKQEDMTLGKWIIAKYNTKQGRDGKLGEARRVGQIQALLDLFGRQSLLAQAKELEQEQYLKIKWTYVNTEIQYLQVFMTRIDDLCIREGVINHRDDFEQKRDLIRGYIAQYQGDDTKQWLLAFYQTTLMQLNGDRKEIPVRARDEKLFSCLNAISELTDDTWKRAFSNQVLGDSKLFENIYQKHVISILCEYSQRVSAQMEDDEVLAEFRIQSYSQVLECKGSFQYELVAGDVTYQIDTSSFYYGHVLNAQTLTNAIATAAEDIRTVMTIENKANYESMLFDKHTLYIYTHGFFSFKERTFLATFAQILPQDVNFYHWSDMDYGGIRIFKFIKDKVFVGRELKPYKMGKDDYMEALAGGTGKEIGEKTLQKLEKVDVVELADLKACILEHGKGFEQEWML